MFAAAEFSKTQGENSRSVLRPDALRAPSRAARWLIAAAVVPLAVAQPALGQSETAARAGAPDILARESFPIGSNDGALCQVQSLLQDPALGGMFDRAWTIICRDAAQAVGRVYALRGNDAVSRVAARPGAPTCSAGQASGDRTMADCGDLFPGVAGRR